MGFRMTDSPFPRTSPNDRRHRCRWFPTSIRLCDTSRAFQCTVSDPRWRPRPSPLAILRERLFSNSGSRVRTFGYPRHAPSLNGERRSRSIKSRLGFWFRFGSRGRDFFKDRGTAEFLRRSTYSPISKRLSARLCARCRLMARFRTCLGDLTISAFGGIADVPITRAEVRS